MVNGGYLDITTRNAMADWVLLGSKLGICNNRKNLRVINFIVG